MRPTAEQSRSNADSGGRFETMTNTRDTRMVMIVDSEPAQQRFLAALASRGGWRSVIAPDTDTALAKLGTQEGMALGAVIPIALATDTFSIATMEVVDNAIMLGVPGAMEAGVGDLLFWGALAVALAIAGFVAFPVNRWLIARGKGHAVLHETGIHGGPPTRVVAAVAAVAAIFGAAVLIAEALDSDEPEGHDEGGHALVAGREA